MQGAKTNTQTGTVSETQSGMVESEIENSLDHIKTQKSTAVGSIKIYMAIVFAYFAYISFIQTKILSGPILSGNMISFSIFGLVLTSFVFMVGWVLLDFITSSIFTSIIHYKHVSNMRGLKAQLFGPDFKKNCIVPIAAKKIHLMRSQQLPVVFSVFNFMILCANYYFLNLSFSSDLSATYAMIIMGVFALYYPNVCAKYHEEILIAQRMNPGKDEEKVRSIVRDRIKRNKEERTHKGFSNAFNWLAIFFFILMLANLMGHYIFNEAIPAVSLYTEMGILFALALLRYMIAQYRVQKVICIFSFQAKKV